MPDSPNPPIEHRDIVIAGGGIAGTATAWYLARESRDVLLLEAGEINSGASGANAGSIHLQIPMAEYISLGPEWARQFAPVLSMLREGAQLWAGLAGMLGRDLEFHRTGGLIVARNDAELERVYRKAALEREHGIEIDVVGRSELRALAPSLDPGLVGGALCPGEGKANPLLAAHAFADAAIAAGAEIRTASPVTGIEAVANGFEIRVAKKRIRCHTLVNAAGAQAGTIAAMLGIAIEVSGYPLQVSVTERTGPLIDHLLYSAAGKLTMKQMANGSCLIGGGWPSVCLPDGTLAVDPRSLAANATVAHAVLPSLSALRILRAWPAMVAGTEDWRPLIGVVPSLPGFYMNMFPWMGFTAGPIAARATAELILGRDPGLDLMRISVLYR